MKPITNRYRVAPLFVVALISLSWMFTPPLRAQTTEANLNKRFDVKPGGQLVMDVDRGGIEITTGETSEVQVEVKRKITGVSGAKAQETLAAHEVTFDRDGSTVEIHARFKPDFLKTFNKAAQKMQVRYEVLVPSKFNLDLRTSAGEISSSDIEGNVKARTAGGSLKFGQVKGPFDGTTSAGSITLAGASGAVSVRTAGGSITLGTLDSEATAETSAGSISVRNAKAKLTAVTHGGGIELGSTCAWRKGWDSSWTPVPAADELSPNCLSLLPWSVNTKAARSAVN